MTTIIHNGPSRWDLMLCLFDPELASGERRFVSFQSEDGDEIEAVIETLNICPSSTFVFAGWIRNSNAPDVPANKYVKGTYNVQSRKGNMETFGSTLAGLPQV